MLTTQEDVRHQGLPALEKIVGRSLEVARLQQNPTNIKMVATRDQVQPLVGLIGV